MRIWSDTLTRQDFYTAEHKAQANIIELTEHKARKRGARWEVKLSGDSPYMTAGGRAHAATWDQWGIFLAKLFELDPEMTTQYYRDAAEFHAVTGDRFRTLHVMDSHRVHHWRLESPYAYGQPVVSVCDCGARIERAA